MYFKRRERLDHHKKIYIYILPYSLLIHEFPAINQSARLKCGILIPVFPAVLKSLRRL